MYTFPTPLSLGSYKSNDEFDIYARTGDIRLKKYGHSG